jgi:hypothetical protein
MGAGTKKRPSTRCATSNGFCGADRHYTDVSFEQQDHQSLSPFIVLLGFCLGAFLAGVTLVVLLDAEIRVDGITYFEIARVASVLPFIIFARPILRGIITVIEWKQRQRVPPGLHSQFALALLVIISLLLPSANAMDKSPTGAGDARAGITYLAAQAGFLCGICRAMFTSVGNLVPLLAHDKGPRPTHDEFGRALLGLE